MRVLHLVHGCDERGAAGNDPALLACRASLPAAPDHAHTVCLLGSTRAASRAALLGLRPDLRLAPLLARPTLAARALRRLARVLPRFDLVHCWDPTLVPLARRALGPRVPVALASPDLLELGDIPAAARSPSALAHERRTLRAALGLPESVPLAALLSESPAAADAEAFAVLLALVEASGHAVAGLAPRGCASLARARRLRRDSGFRFPFLVTDAPVWHWLPACDAAVLAQTHDSSPALRRACVLLAHRVGVPVLAFRTPDLAPLYPPPLDARLLGDRRFPDSRGPLLAALVDRDRHDDTAARARRHASDPARLRARRDALERSWLRAVGSLAPEQAP